MAKPSEPARLLVPTPAHIANVTDVLEHSWSEKNLLIMQRLQHALERDDHNAVSKYTLAGCQATDKLLLLKGRPTEIVGHVHAHRHELGRVFAKVAEALRPATADTPLIPAPSLPTKIVDIPTQIVGMRVETVDNMSHNDAAQHGHVSPK